MSWDPRLGKTRLRGVGKVRARVLERRGYVGELGANKQGGGG